MFLEAKLRITYKRCCPTIIQGNCMNERSATVGFAIGEQSALKSKAVHTNDATCLSRC
jgi:hypothetical protein